MVAPYEESRQPPSWMSRHRPAVPHPQNDGRAGTAAEFRRRYARVRVGFDGQHVTHLELVERVLRADRIRQDDHETWLLLGAPRVGIHDRRATTTLLLPAVPVPTACYIADKVRSEEHTSELQSRENLVCRLLLEKKKKKRHILICCINMKLYN